MADLRVPTCLIRAPAQFGGVPEGAFQRGQPIWRDGRLVGLEPSKSGPAQIAIPRLSEVHCHLDKCHTLHRLDHVGGDLRAALEAQFKDKQNWTAEDLHARMSRGVAELTASGCKTARTHIDWGDTADPPLAWSVANALETGSLDLECAALTSVIQLADRDFARQVARTVANVDHGVLGAFLLDHPEDKVRSALKHAFEFAAQFGLALDFHVDEGLGNTNGLEMIADAAMATRFEGPILCGHAVSLVNRPASDIPRISDKLARANIAVCALPTTNLYLQGRRDGTPDRRGITLLRELRAAGVRVVVGSDNVADAFCPVGQHDPMAALNLAVLAAHLDPPLDQWLPLVTTDAAQALGRDPIFVDGARREDLLLSDTTSIAGFIAGRHPLKGAET